jgi:hypothetical protein
MSREQDNKAIVARWFEGFWANPWNPEIIDELAAPDMPLQYSLHAPRRGHEDVRNFMEGFRAGSRTGVITQPSPPNRSIRAYIGAKSP